MNQPATDYFPQSKCILVISDWAPLSQSCRDVFEEVKNNMESESLKFIVKDYDKDYDQDLRDKYNIKGVPLWRFCSEDKVEHEQYGGYLSVLQLKAFVRTYLM